MKEIYLLFHLFRESEEAREGEDIEEKEEEEENVEEGEEEAEDPDWIEGEEWGVSRSESQGEMESEVTENGVSDPVPSTSHATGKFYNPVR